MSAPLTEYQLAILDQLEFVGDDTFSQLHTVDYRIGQDDISALLSHGAISVVRQRDGTPVYGITNTGRDILIYTGSLPYDPAAYQRGRPHRMTAPDYITTTEAARRLGVPVRTVQQRVTAGTLPAIRIGRNWVIAATDLPGIAPPPMGRRLKADAKPESVKRRGKPR
jgi:excisionase family DNA binding protein